MVSRPKNINNILQNIDKDYVIATEIRMNSYKHIIKEGKVPGSGIFGRLIIYSKHSSSTLNYLPQ